MIANMAGAQSGIPSCSSLSVLPIVQDDKKGSFWSAMGMSSNGYAVVGPDGVLAVRLMPGSLPTDAPKLEAAVESILP